jgi:hypothetical protein
MMKMTRATGSRNEAPPMIVVFRNSFKGSFHLKNVIDAKNETIEAATATLW